MDKRVSLADVARSTGFAVPTISLALRNMGTMSLKTRKKIQKAAHVLGYYPNPLLASLASKHFGARQPARIPLAYIDSLEGVRTRNSGIEELFKLAQDYGRKMGYSLEVFDVGDFKDGAHATQVLFARGVQGIIVRHDFELGTLPGMDWSRFSVVGLGESTVASPNSLPALLCRTAVDHFGLVLQAWNETRKRGYQRIGFAFFSLDYAIVDDQLRWSAAELCLKRISRRFRIPTLLLNSKTDGQLRELSKWVDRHRPDAVIGFNEIFLWLLKEGGYRIPEDIGFVNLHLPSGVPGTAQGLQAGMKEAMAESMTAAIELLDQHVRHHQTGMAPQPRTVMVHSMWMDGETLPEKSLRHQRA